MFANKKKLLTFLVEILWLRYSWNWNFKVPMLLEEMIQLRH
jgi:hypothetical protein